MKDINIFCFGFGQVAKNFIKKLYTEQYNISLSATSRSESSKKIFNGINYNSYLFNSEEFDKNLVIKDINHSPYYLIFKYIIRQKNLILSG